MGKNINLNSSEWRDLVFEGKNKAYGAYKLRQTSSKRHIAAFLAVLVFVALVGVTPYFLEAVKPNKDYLGGMDEQMKMANVDEEKEEEEKVIPPEEITPPPPPMKATIQFTPPIVADDKDVTEDNTMKRQEELQNATQQIGAFNNLGGSTDDDAIDPEKALANQQQAMAPPPDPEENKVFKVVEQPPTYPGGMKELMSYLASNIKYPAIAAENGIEGKAIIVFEVGKDGSISHVRVARSLDPACDKEAMRVVRSMPSWIPGKQNGRAVKVEYTLPVTFQLQK